MKRNLYLAGAMLIISSSLFAQQENEIQEVSLATKTKEKRYKTGKNVQLITQKDLEKYKGQQLSDVLDQIAGIQIAGNFNNSAEPKSMKIRGGKSGNVLILLDGVPLKDVTGNDYTVSDLRLIALENVESIEVLGGASSVLFGSNASVSVINIKTKTSAKKRIEGRLLARAGSFGTYAQDIATNGKIQNFYYQINGFNEKSMGISAAEGENFDKDGFEKQAVSAKLGYKNDAFEAGISSGWNHNLFQYDAASFMDGKNRGNDKQFYIGGNMSYSYSPSGKLVFNTRYTSVNRITQNIENDAYRDNLQYQGENIFGELYNSYKINEHFNFVGGVQYERQALASSAKPWNKNQLEEVLNCKDTFINTFDVFANANANFYGFNLDAGARFSHHSQYNNHWVYSVNPYYLGDLGEKYFKIGYSYATAFISPTLFQNFGYGQWSIVPNPNLKPETNGSHEIDLAFGKKDYGYNLSVSLYERNEKDIMIFAYLPNYTSQYQNLEKNKTKGIEVTADYTLNKYVKIGGNFSYVEKDQETTMLRIPKQRINGYVEVHPLKNTGITIAHQFIGKRADYYYDSSFVRKDVLLDSFHLFNLNINQKIAEKFEFFANIGNLFNTSYVDIVGYKTKPRNYTFGVSYQF